MTHEISPTDISTFLDTKSDFTFEQAVLFSLSSRGIQATYGGTYIDPVTDKHRQYDIRALKVFDGEYGVSMAIECKALTSESPLIVQRVPRPAAEGVHEVIRCGLTERGDRDPSTPRCDTGRRVYMPDEKVGKQITQLIWDQGHRRLVSNDRDRDTYDKWTQALASCSGLVDEALKAFRTRSVRHFYTFVMPILVVPDGSLWAVDYSETGARDRDPERTDEATLFVDRKFDRQHISYYVGHLHIYTLSGLTRLLDDLRKDKGSTFRDKVFSYLLRAQATA